LFINISINKENDMDYDLADLIERIEACMKTIRKFPCIFKVQIEELEDALILYEDILQYSDNLGFINLEKALLDYLATLSFIHYSKYILKRNEALEVTLAGKSMDGRYIIMQATSIDDEDHPQYIVLGYGLEGFIKGMEASAANKIVDILTANSSTDGKLIKAVTIHYLQDVSSYKIIEHPYSFVESKKRKPIFENLKEYDSTKGYLSSYAKRRTKQ